MSRRQEDPVWDAASLRCAHGLSDKSIRVRRMFNAIAPTYERVNHLFSAGRDAAWRRRAVELAGIRADDVVLDVACGTGDFLRAFAAASGSPRRLGGCDFAHEMLTRAAKRGPPSLCWCECDALCLPFREESFTVVSCAFGVRNFQSLDAGLAEMCRVLRRGGRAVILEFTRPRRGPVRTLYEVYARCLMPAAAQVVSGDRTGAYRYLPESVVSFATAQEMCQRLEQAGFGHVRHTPLTWGVVTAYLAVKGSP